MTYCNSLKLFVEYYDTDVRSAACHFFIFYRHRDYLIRIMISLPAMCNNTPVSPEALHTTIQQQDPQY